MKDLFIRPHLGLGDAIICNGLVRHFAKFEPDRIIHVPCKTHNVASVRMMFSDLGTVEVKPVADDLAADRMAQEFEDAGIAEIERLGGSGNGFDRQFYESAGVPFEERWTEFLIPPCPFVQPWDKPWDFHFVHDDPGRGFAIDWRKLPKDKRIVTPYRTRSITDWIHTIQRASQIHCIPSSFSLLADSLGSNASEYFLHVSARPGGELPTYRKNWTIL